MLEYPCEARVLGKDDAPIEAYNLTAPMPPSVLETSKGEGRSTVQPRQFREFEEVSLNVQQSTVRVLCAAAFFFFFFGIQINISGTIYSCFLNLQPALDIRMRSLHGVVVFTRNISGPSSLTCSYPRLLPESRVFLERIKDASSSPPHLACWGYGK